MAKVKVFQKKVKLQVQGQKVKIMVPCERSGHKEYTYEIWKLYLIVIFTFCKQASESFVGPVEFRQHWYGGPVGWKC